MSLYLKSLHWLPIKQRIEFKWYVLTYKIVKFGLPPYFGPYFASHSSKLGTRRSSADNMYLSRDVIPFSRGIHRSKVQYDHCFYVSAPVLWNKLPSNIRCAPTLSSIRSRLK